MLSDFNVGPLTKEDTKTKHFKTESEFRTKFNSKEYKIISLPTTCTSSQNEYRVIHCCQKQKQKIIKILVIMTLGMALLFSYIRKAWEASKGERISVSKKAVIYMPSTGNPAHRGHMNVVATAINTLIKEGFYVEGAQIGLSAQSHADKKEGQPVPVDVRKAMLDAAIQDAQKENMFQGVNVQRLPNLESKGGHPAQYRQLDVQEKEKTLSGVPAAVIVLAAGADLAVRMKNWQHSGIPYAVIVGRSGVDDEKIPSNPADTGRWRAEANPKFASFSSTQIRNCADGWKESLGPNGLKVWNDYLINNS